MIIYYAKVGLPYPIAINSIVLATTSFLRGNSPAYISRTELFCEKPAPPLFYFILFFIPAPADNGIIIQIRFRRREFANSTLRQERTSAEKTAAKRNVETCFFLRNTATFHTTIRKIYYLMKFLR